MTLCVISDLGMILGRFQNGKVSGCGFCRQGLKHYHVRTYVYISHTYRTRTRYWGSRQTLKLYHVHVYARSQVLGSPLLPSWETLHWPAARPPSARKLFCRGGDRLQFRPLPMSSVTSALQIPISAVYVSFFHRLGMSFCLLSSRLFRSALLGFYPVAQRFWYLLLWCLSLRRFLFRLPSIHRLGILLWAVWESVGMPSARLGSPLLMYTKSSWPPLKFSKRSWPRFKKWSWPGV